MKKTTLFLIVSIFFMLTITACGRECTCNCNCNTSIVDNREVEATLEPTLESTSKFEETEFEDDESYEEDEEIDEEKAKKVYNEAKKLYRSGKWDGNPMILESLTVSLNESGDIFVNDKQVYGWKNYVDLPEDFDCEDVDSWYEYVPGQGVYAIKDKALIKYVRGEKVSLGVLNAKGSLNCTELEDTRLPYLYFDEESKKLILITGNLDSKTYYLYVVPDYNTSKVEYVAEISDWNIHGYAAWHVHEFHLYYTDLKGVEWIWSKEGPEIYSEY